MASSILSRYREQHPYARDLSDVELARSLHRDHYADWSIADFADRIGLSVLDRYRVAHPDRASLDDQALARSIHQAHYSDLEFSDFAERIGLSEPPSALDLAIEGGRQGIASLYESFYQTPGAIKRIAIDLPNQVTDRAIEALGGDPARLNPRIPMKTGAFGRFFEEQSKAFAQWREQGGDPAARDALLERAELANQALSAAATGDLTPAKEVLTDPRSWAGFMGQAAPSLAVALLTKGSASVIAWMEAMEAAKDAEDFEQRTGVALTPAEFTRAVAQVGAANAILEKAGVDQILKPGKGSAATRIAKGAIAEGSTEAAQSVSSNIGAQTYDESRGLSEDVLAGAMGGFGTGAAASTGAVGAEALEKRRSREDPSSRLDTDSDIVAQEQSAGEADPPSPQPVPNEESATQSRGLDELVEQYAEADSQPAPQSDDAEPAETAKPTKASQDPVRARADASSPSVEPEDTPRQDPGTDENEQALRRRLSAIENALASATPLVRDTLLVERDRLERLIEKRRRKLTPMERAAQLRTIRPSEDDLTMAIQKLGGIDTELESDFAGRLKGQEHRRPGLPALERPGKGRSLDDLAESLQEEGYLLDRDVFDLSERLERIGRGEQIFSIAREAEALDAHYASMPAPRRDRAEAEEQRIESRLEAEAEILALAQEYALTSAQAGQRFEESGYLPGDNTSRQLQESVEYGLAIDESATEQIIEHAAMQGLTDAEIITRLEQEVINAVRDETARAQSQRAENSESRAGSATQGRSLGVSQSRTENARAVEEPSGVNQDLFGAQPDLLPSRRGHQHQPGSSQPALDIQPVSSLRPVSIEGARLSTLTDTNRTVSYTLPDQPVRTAEDAAVATAQVRKNAQENLLALVTDAEGNVLDLIRHSIGDVNSAAVNAPILAGSILRVPNARHVWLSHNHPAGESSLSSADHRVLERMESLMRGSGVEVEAMIAVGDNNYSFVTPHRDEITDASLPPARRTRRITASERVLKKRGRLGRTIIDAEAALNVVDAVSNDESGVLLLNNRHHPVAWVPLHPDAMRRLRGTESLADLLRAIEQSNANTAVVSTGVHDPDADDVVRSIANVEVFLSKAGVNVLDIVIPSRNTTFQVSGRFAATALDEDFFRIAAEDIAGTSVSALGEQVRG